MILKVVTFFFLPFLFIALILASFGVQQVTLDNNFYGFLMQVNAKMSGWGDWGFIPDIPSIPLFVTDGNNWFAVLNVLINLVNGLASILNVLIMLLNFEFRAVQFLISFISVLLQGLDWLAHPIV